MTEEIKTIAPFPDDLNELLKFAFCAGAGFDHPNKFDEATDNRWRAYGRRPVPLSTYQRVSHAVGRAADPDPEEVKLTRKQMDSILRAAYPLATKEERQSIFEKATA